MPRVSKVAHSFKAQRPTRKAANALGYAKRKSLKSKAITNASDVYEYQPENVRRSRVKLLLEKDELVGAANEGSGSEDEQESGRQHKELRPRLVGETNDDDGIGEDEDEDIDSDAAFDESDEDRFAGFGFSHKKSKTALKSKKPAKIPNAKGVHFAEVDLNEDSDEPGLDGGSESEDGGSSEDEEDEEEGDPDEFLDVLDVLDGRGEADSGDDLGDAQRVKTTGVLSPIVRTQPQNVSEDESGTDEDDNESEGGEDASYEEPTMIEPDEDIDVDDSALQNLESFITGLDAGTKRKAPGHDGSVDTDSGDPRKRRRRVLKEQTQVGPENEFAAQAGATKLALDDLLAPLASSSSNLQSLKKSAKVLASSSSKAKTLAAPLPQRTQERLDREAAYEQTKEEIDKWSATIKRIKEAEHLSFPLQAEPVGKPSNLELTAKFKPTTEMESAVDRLLKSAKMREEDITQTESLKMNHLSVEEVAARRADLAKMRELMFRNEAKAKRIAKIKSKTYRRIRKKQKEKLAGKLAELTGEVGDEEDEEMHMKMEVDRARERATLRHKNTGKWAKAMKGRNELDEDQRKEINEMLDRGEKLRRRIQGQGSDEESGDEESDSDGSGEDAIERMKASAFEELIKLQGEDDEAPEESGKKSVFEMKFMKDAALRERHRVDRMADDFIKEMGDEVLGEDGDAGEGEGEVAVHAQDTAAQRIGGRVSYRPGDASTLQVFPSLASASDTSSVTLKSTDFPPSDHPESPLPLSPIPETQALAVPSNPWLPHEGAQTVQKKHELAVSKDSASAEKSKNKLRKRVKKREEEKGKVRDDATVDISMSNIMTLGSSTSNAASSERAAKGKQKEKVKTGVHPSADDDDEDDNSELDEQERALESKGKGKTKGVKAFEQRELVALAFAGDNVVRDFAETKRREIHEDAPKEVDMTLPGWGSWGGLGTKKAPPKPYLIKKIAGVDPTTRADYNKAHVIISEKRDKKAAKYMVKDLPYPYTSKAQFERSMDTPIGSEWNTRVGFQRGTLPKVVKKMGTVIMPLEKLV